MGANQKDKLFACPYLLTDSFSFSVQKEANNVFSLSQCDMLTYLPSLTILCKLTIFNRLDSLKLSLQYIIFSIFVYFFIIDTTFSINTHIFFIVVVRGEILSIFFSRPSIALVLLHTSCSSDSCLLRPCLRSSFLFLVDLSTLPMLLIFLLLDSSVLFLALVLVLILDLVLSSFLFF